MENLAPCLVLTVGALVRGMRVTLNMSSQVYGQWIELDHVSLCVGQLISCSVKLLGQRVCEF